jgi:hypothetical protein
MSREKAVVTILREAYNGDRTREGLCWGLLFLIV